MSYLAQGPRVGVRRIELRDYEELAVLDQESADLHRPWMPAPPATASYDGFVEYLARFEQPMHEGFVFCQLESGAIVGRININNIVRGSHQCGTVGYAAYAPSAGRGYMTEGLRLIVRYAFGTLSLHRLEANIQPGNAASQRLAERAGFRREGFSPNFQFLNGAWRDHERWAITVEMADG